MSAGFVQILALLDDEPFRLLAASVEEGWIIRRCRNFAGVVMQYREGYGNVLVVSPSALAALPETGPEQLRCFPAASDLPLVVFACRELHDLRSVRDTASNGWNFELALWSRDGQMEVFCLS
jgi:hypothetical protein